MSEYVKAFEKELLQQRRKIIELGVFNSLIMRHMSSQTDYYFIQIAPLFQSYSLRYQNTLKRNLLQGNIFVSRGRMNIKIVASFST